MNITTCNKESLSKLERKVLVYWHRVPRATISMAARNFTKTLYKMYTIEHELIEKGRLVLKEDSKGTYYEVKNLFTITL